MLYNASSSGTAMRTTRAQTATVFAAFTLSCAMALCQTAEQRTARRFESVKQQPSLLLPFLREMPKGGDLHNHLSGALYAENLIDYSVQSGLCVDRTTSVLLAPP